MDDNMSNNNNLFLIIIDKELFWTCHMLPDYCMFWTLMSGLFQVILKLSTIFNVVIRYQLYFISFHSSQAQDSEWQIVVLYLENQIIMYYKLLSRPIVVVSAPKNYGI